MKFAELVRQLEDSGFALVKEKGSIRYYGKQGWDKLLTTKGRLSWIEGSPQGHLPRHPKGSRYQEAAIGIRYDTMINLPYSLIIEATADPDFFGFYSTELEGFTGIGHSVEDCLYKAHWGMQEHIGLLAEQNLPVPPVNPNPTVVIQNEGHAAVA